MDYGGAWQSGAPYGNGGSAPGDAPALPYVTPSESFPGGEPTYRINSVHDPHLFTTHCVRPRKNANDSRLGIDVFEAGVREEYVADSGATFHVTGDPSGMVECAAPPADRRSLEVSDMRPLMIECFGKLPLAMHCS